MKNWDLVDNIAIMKEVQALQGWCDLDVAVQRIFVNFGFSVVLNQY